MSPGTAGILDPIETVEDINDNGADDRNQGVKESTRIVNNSVLDGDLYILGWSGANQQLSTFNINPGTNDLVELPVAVSVAEIGVTTQEYTRSHVLKHTISHELGHAVGIPHTPLFTCLMYEYSPDWSRDTAFSDEAISYIQIHNFGPSGP